MNTAELEILKEELFSKDSEYRELVREHKRCDSRVDQLLSLQHPNEDELKEATLLKRKKLTLKDQIETIIKRKVNGH